MKAVDWFRTIAFPLNDDEPTRPFQRYPLKDLVAAYNAAICLVAKYRPDLFTELRIVELVPGKYQDVRGCCVNVLDVLDQTDAAGNLIKELSGARKKPTTVKRNWKKPTCLSRTHAELGYLVDNANIDRNLIGRFTVDPPVPCDVSAFVMVKCVGQPCELSELDQNKELDSDCTFNVAAWHFVLARMLSGDRFANAAGGDAQYHYRMFFEILGVVQRQEDRIESPEQA